MLVSVPTPSGLNSAPYTGNPYYFSEGIWLGARRTTSGSHEYEDHTKFDFMNFKPSEPNNIGGHDCVMVFKWFLYFPFMESKNTLQFILRETLSFGIL